MKNAFLLGLNRLVTFLPVLFIFIWSCGNDPEVKPDPAPTITGISRTLSVPGKELIITGTNFSATPANNIVTFNGTPSSVTAATPTQLTTTVPFGATTGNIIVSVNGVSATGPIFIVYVTGTVTDISPVCGPIGTVVTISGMGFETNPSNTSVLFRSTGNLLVHAPVTSATSTQLTVTVPAGAETGNIYLAAFGSETLEMQSSLSLFSITPFTLVTFSPESVVAGPGNTVTVTGSGFDTTPSNNVVSFRGFDGTTVSTLNGTVTSASNTQLIVTVPLNVLTGPISVQVKGSSFISFRKNLLVTF